MSTNVTSEASQPIRLELSFSLGFYDPKPSVTSKRGRGKTDGKILS